MSRLLSLGLGFVLHFAAFAQTAASAPPLEKGEITIKTYNYAGVREETLDQAFSLASRVYSRAGVSTVWLSCPLPGDANRNPVCERTKGETVLMLNILPPSMAARSSVPDGVFGLAVLSADGSRARLAYVFHDRVQNLASDARHSVAVVLGHVMAHEVGHLLLGSNSHSRSGIMTADWFGRNLRSAAQGQLLFTASQSARMREEIAARQRDSQTTQTAQRSPGS